MSNLIFYSYVLWIFCSHKNKNSRYYYLHFTNYFSQEDKIKLRRKKFTNKKNGINIYKCEQMKVTYIVKQVCIFYWRFKKPNLSFCTSKIVCVNGILKEADWNIFIFIFWKRNLSSKWTILFIWKLHELQFFVLRRWIRLIMRRWE